MKYQQKTLKRWIMDKAKEGQRVNFILCEAGGNTFKEMQICDVDETIEDDGEEVLTVYLVAYKEA